MINGMLTKEMEEFDRVIEDIKQANLSRSNMPKLIVGTGLSVAYGVPGMAKLSKYLSRKISKVNDPDLKYMWDKHYPNIKKEGLEAGLAGIESTEDRLVEIIKKNTAEYILDSEEKIFEKILLVDTGFSKLLAYLRDTVGVSQKIIDIMTPNYDRIIEIVCDKLGIGVITGFTGSLHGNFKGNILKHPAEVYNCKNHTWVRLFKPHGSINWINENGKEYLTNNYNILKKKTEYIDIVTPGSSKYKMSLVNNTLRFMREEFNELLTGRYHYSLIIYGYGFNDAHFNTVLYECFEHKNILILAREVKQDIIDKALAGKNITIFYHKDSKDYMIHKGTQYIVDIPLWDINQFADVFLG